MEASKWKIGDFIVGQIKICEGENWDNEHYEYINGIITDIRYIPMMYSKYLYEIKVGSEKMELWEDDILGLYKP